MITSDIFQEQLYGLETKCLLRPTLSSYMQKFAPRFRVQHINNAHNILRDTKYLDGTIRFRGVDMASRMEIHTYSDASFNVITER